MEKLYIGHRFILAARSLKWDPQQLGDTTELDLSGKNYFIRKEIYLLLLFEKIFHMMLDFN